MMLPTASTNPVRMRSMLCDGDEQRMMLLGLKRFTKVDPQQQGGEKKDCRQINKRYPISALMRNKI